MPTSRAARPPRNRPHERTARKRPGVSSILRRPSPAMPFRTSGSDLPSVVVWPPRFWLSTSLKPWVSFESRRLGSHPRAPCRGARFLDLDVVRGLLQPNSTRGHTRRAADPRARVRLSPRYSPAYDAGCVGRIGALPHRGPASRDLHTPAFTVAFHLRGGADHGPKRSSQGARALDESVRTPSRCAPGTRVAGPISPPSLDDLMAPRTGRDPS